MDASGPGGSGSAFASDTEDSFRFGIGADYRLQDTVFIRDGYVWADYGSYSERDDDVRVGVDLEDHLFRPGIGGAVLGLRPFFLRS